MSECREGWRGQKKNILCHGQHSRTIMFRLKVLVGKVSPSVYTRTTRTVSVQEISALNHKILDLYIYKYIFIYTPTPQGGGGKAISRLEVSK